ncbi:MAG: hypothetical protein IJ222_03210 [Bacteroidales bacterium]|nr:hypothetical protein [Bacteroidales bacterium]
MKKSLFLFAAFVGFFCNGTEAESAESVRLVTDKQVYVAGDLIWCSAFCTDGEKLSSASAVAYVELVSSDGVAATSKIALVGGRGTGVMPLPASIPTGNYKIFAYTAISETATASDISVFNTMSGIRVRGGVEICDDELPKAIGGRVVEGPVSIRTEKLGEVMRIILYNGSSKDATVAVSVSEDDALRPAFSPQMITLTPREAEPDGEIVRAFVYGPDALSVRNRPWLTALISSPGSAADTYTGKIGSDGIITFNTNNIYGDRDLVCEILGLEDEKLDCHFSPQSPFVTPDGLSFEKMRLSPSMRQALAARHEALKAEAKADTLYDFLPKRDNLLFSSKDCTNYHLDDYTRFNTIEDILLELVPNVGVRKVKGHKQIKMIIADALAKTRSSNVLVMLDGVPVSNHERLLAYDALALSDVYVYPYNYAMGKTVFSGVVNFVTAKHDMSALRFADNVRIIDFRGCSFPLALKEGSAAPGEPAGRTLLWQPALSIKAGESAEFSMSASDAALFIKLISLNY